VHEFEGLADRYPKGTEFHPREALPNTTALARADALYVELVGHARDVLGSAIANATENEKAREHQKELAGYLARYCAIDHFSYLDQLPAARLRELERAAHSG
jgi:hypothetical protein